MKRLLFSLIMLPAIIISKAQTADDVINKYVEALGGKDKLSGIQSLHTVGIATAPNGAEITTETWRVNGKLYRRVTDFGMGSSTQLITEAGGWSTNPRSGGSFEAMPEPMLSAQKFEMDAVSPLFDYAAKGHKVELAATEKLNGKDHYKIKLTTKEGRELNYFIDATTHYITQMSFKRGGRGGQGGNADAEVVVTYSNYDKTPEGYIFAFSQSITGAFGGAGGGSITTTFEKLEVNPKIDEKLYKAE
jgi:hypothetical protein